MVGGLSKRPPSCHTSYTVSAAVVGEAVQASSNEFKVTPLATRLVGAGVAVVSAATEPAAGEGAAILRQVKANKADVKKRLRSTFLMQGKVI